MPDDLSHIEEPLRPLAVPIGTLREDPDNVRAHDPRNVDAIKASLDNELDTSL